MHDDAVLTGLRDVIVRAARGERTVTYAQLLDALPSHQRDVASADLATYLRALSVSEDNDGRALLTAIVVRDDDGLPGAGWFRLAEDRGRDVDRRGRRAVWEEEVQAVFAAWREQ